MTEQTIHSVFVLGAGTMGAGIAEVAIKAGATAILADVHDDLVARGVSKIEASLKKAVEKGKLSEADAAAARERLSTATELAFANDADLVVEAVPEDMALKKKLFAELSSIAEHAILASNTSSLSVTEIAAAAAVPSNVIGLHFFNPPPVMPLLEIVRAEQTSEVVLARCLAWAKTIGKTPIVVRDFPGFATSRLGIILGMEAIRMLESGVASAEDIDRAMELGYKHPMGPLKLTDLVGLDVRLAIAEHLTRELGPQFTPPPLLRRLVRAGKLGKKTGEGFYRWNGDTTV
ncbi:3-hydroxyacyl-CoA dehydrogenase family protein [Myxococcota bacterium]|nr:3-hydroxyacyl-CoA dehydrogenase family protein [Myxococcota bacterium]